MAHGLHRQRAITTFVAFGKARLGTLQRIGFGALQFGCGKAKAACAFGFADNGTKRTAYVVFFTAKR